MRTLDYIAKKYGLDLKSRSPIDIHASRNDLGNLFKELGFTKGAEIGVERGIFSETLLKANPNLTLYCVDPWKAYRGYREHVTQTKLNEIYLEAINRLKPYKCWIIRRFSENAYQDFPDGSLDFVYIDGNHDLLHTTQDLTNWVPKVKPGGIVSGHDFVGYKGKYGLFNRAKEAVKTYVQNNGIHPYFAIRNPGERTSWMWVKE